MIFSSVSVLHLDADVGTARPSTNHLLSPPPPRRNAENSNYDNAVRISARGDTPRTSRALREDSSHDFSMDVSQPKIASGITVCESLVIEPEQIENGGVQVVNVNRILDSL